VPENNTERFLSLFKNLTSDNLSIKSIEYLTDSTEYLFRGKMVDTSFYRFIKDRYMSLRLDKYSGDNYYACFKKTLMTQLIF
jgi:hypothetical protein